MMKASGPLFLIHANCFDHWRQRICWLLSGAATTTNGSTVLATGKGENRLPFQHTRFIYKSMDFTSAEVIATVFKSSRPAIVIHCGAMSKPDECELKNREIAYQVNVGGTLNLLNEAKNYKSHFRSGKG